MCEAMDEFGDRPGLLGSAWGWFRRRGAEEASRMTEAEQEEATNAIRGWAMVRGKTLCRECGAILGDEPGETCGLLDRRLCYSCDITWLEDRILRPLVERLRRRGARKALRKLVRRAKALV